MKRFWVSAVLVVLAASGPATAAYYVAGDFNGWNAAGDLMTETSPGVYQVALAGLNLGRHEFKVTVGDWSQNWPGSGNAWLYTDGAGNIVITYDSRTHADGWSCDGLRLGLSMDPGAWTAAGDWQGWSNANPATAMVALGGGLYRYQQTLVPGSYQYMAVVTGSWDAIGADARSVNANSIGFQVTPANTTAVFYVDALRGTAKVDVVPEPAALSLLVLGGLVLRARRRPR